MRAWFTRDTSPNSYAASYLNYSRIDIVITSLLYSQIGQLIGLFL